MRRPINHNQRGVLGTLAIALIAAALFYVPWRIESTQKLAWAPFYRNPVIAKNIRMDQTTVSRFERLKGQRVWWLWGAQLVAIGAAGGIAFRLMADPPEGDHEDAE